MTDKAIPFSTAAWSLLGAFSLALALPLLGTLGSGPTFFVAHAAQGIDIGLFALCVYLLLPSLFCLLLVLAGGRRRSALSAALASLVVGLAIALWALSALKGLTPVAAMGLAVIVGVVVGICFHQNIFVRPLLIIIGQISVVIPLYFLFMTPAKSLLLSADGITGGSNSSASDTPVVVLVLDEMPTTALMDASGGIDPVRFPNFLRLQEISTWYRNATTVSTNTHLAISAIHSGRRPDAGTLPIPGQLPQNIFSLLASSHRVFAIESVSRLCTPALCESQGRDASLQQFDAGAFYGDVLTVWLHTLLPTPLADQHLPSIAGKWRDFSRPSSMGSSKAAVGINVAMTDGFDAKHTAQWETFIGRLGEYGAVLNYLHLGLPHHPWIYLPDGTVYNGRDTPATTYTHDWREQPALVGQASLRFAMQMEHVDRLIGEMLDGLEKQGRLEDTLLIVLSDHGLAIAPGAKRRAPEQSTFVDVAAVPLFIKYPRQASGSIDDRVVETIDILPTIAHTLGIPLFDAVDGQALSADNWVQAQRQVIGATESVLAAASDLDFSPSVERFRRWLLPRENASQSWALASGGDFLGQPVEGFELSTAGLSFVLERPEWYRQVSLNSGFLPVRLTGTVTGAARGTPVYIALNGSVAGGSVVHDRKGSLSVMLHPDHFREGENMVAAFVVEGGEGEGGKLARIATVSADVAAWKISLKTDGGYALEGADGRRYKRDPGKTGSAVISRDAPLAAIVGAAFDVEKGVTPDALLLVDGERLVTDNFRAFLGRSANNPMGEALVSTFTVEITTDLAAVQRNLYVLAVWSDGTFLPIPVTDNTVLFQ